MRGGDIVAEKMSELISFKKFSFVDLTTTSAIDPTPYFFINRARVDSVVLKLISNSLAIALLGVPATIRLSTARSRFVNWLSACLSFAKRFFNSISEK